MIKTPYHFEANLSDQEFQKIGQFACRWALIEHTIANCLREMLGMEMEEAREKVFYLTLHQRMERISKLAEQRLTEYQLAVLAELQPLIKAIRYLRNTALHGVVTSFGDDPDQPFFHLRSHLRDINIKDLFACDDLIKYTAHVTQAFRLSLGNKTYEGYEEGHTYVLPHRPRIPEFLPEDCKLPKDDTALIREGK